MSIRSVSRARKAQSPSVPPSAIRAAVERAVEIQPAEATAAHERGARLAIAVLREIESTSLDKLTVDPQFRRKGDAQTNVVAKYLTGADGRVPLDAEELKGFCLVLNEYLATAMHAGEPDIERLADRASMRQPEPEQSGDVPPEVCHVYLECALRHLRCADSLLAEGQPLTAEMEDVAEVIRSAAENLTTWLDSPAAEDEDGTAVFDALDACTVTTALIEAGLNPRNGKTVSPIKGTLRLAVERLEEWQS